MANLRTINVDLNRQYRNDLNWNFQQIEALTGISTSEITRVERESKERDDFLAGTSVDAIIQRIDTAANNADVKAVYAETQGDYAKEQGDYAKSQGNYANDKGVYAEEKAVLADLAAANANTEASNLSQLKVDVVEAIQNTNKAVEDLAPFGAYDSGMTYQPKNIVMYQGSGFMNIAESTGVIPTDETHWKKIVSRGERGIPGAGSGTVSSVNGVEPDGGGNVELVIPDPDLSNINSQLANHESRLNTLENGSTAIATNVSGLYRGQAWLMLKQQAADRIENGVTFADDMNGNRLGFELDTVASENVIVRDGKMLMNEIVTNNYSAVDKVVIANAYQTHASARPQRLSNGWIVTVEFNVSVAYFQVSKDNGNSFVPLCRSSNVFGKKGMSLASKGTTLYFIKQDLSSGTTLNFIKIDATTVVNGDLDATRKNIDTGQNNFEMQSSLTVDPTNGHLHAAWASKNATYPNSFNIRYSKSVDGGVTWSVVEQVSKFNSVGLNQTNPSIVVRSGQPYIFSEFGEVLRVITPTGLGSDSSFFSWTFKTVYSSPAYFQYNVSAITDKDDTFHSTWHGRDATHPTTDYIRYSKSPDGGVTWSAMQKLHPGTNASISTNSLGQIFITYQDAGVTKFIKSIDKGDSWSVPTVIGTGTNPTTLDDNTVNFTVPLTARMGATNVLFNGEWSEQVEEPRLTAKAVYNIPSTDYVGAFVQKIGDITITATLNDVPMPSELEGNEYLFEDTLAVKAPAKLTLNLSRTSTTGGENDAITRILGGRS